MRYSSTKLRAAFLAVLFVLMSNSAHALFEDVDARRSLLDLRREVNELSNRIDGKIQALNQSVDSKVQPLSGRIDGKADTRALLKLSEDIEKLRQDLATLRGQIEVLTNDVTKTERRQKDFYVDLDQRLRAIDQKQSSIDTRQATLESQLSNFEGRQLGLENRYAALESKLSTLEGRSGADRRPHETDALGRAAPVAADDPLAEQKSYDLALTLFKSQDYRGAAKGFTDFLKRFPESNNLAQAYFWLGSSHYALQDCVSAIPAFQTVITRFTNSQRAADAMLSLAECQSDMKDKTAARQTLNNLIKRFPNSTAAKTGKERLSELR